MEQLSVPVSSLGKQEAAADQQAASLRSTIQIDEGNANNAEKSEATAEEAVATSKSVTPRKGRGAKQQQQPVVPQKSNNQTNLPKCRKPNNQRADCSRPHQNKSKGASNQEKSSLIERVVDYDVLNQNSENKSNGNGSRFKSSAGSRKQNLNHLLNFTYESVRDSTENYYEYERLSKQFWSTKLTKNSYFSKEQFLQANCQFVVKTCNDYSVHMCDPDRLVNWNHIEEVHIDTHSTIACPICLYEPTAGKITKCGHVYCWSCILHYLSLSDKSWRKCPICFESIYKSDLKSVRVIKRKHEYRAGDEIELALMFKPRLSKYGTLCLPISAIDSFVRDERNGGLSYCQFGDANKYDIAECATYLKIHEFTPQQIRDIVLNRERDELKKQLDIENDLPEVCFVNEALALLHERELQITEEINKSPRKKDETMNSKKIVEKEEQLVHSDKSSISYVDEEVFEAKNESSSFPVECESKQIKARANISTNSNDRDFKLSKLSDSGSISPLELTYFYQSSDGQRIFISGFNNRCLLAEFSSLNCAPHRIKARIIASESLFMTEENRRQRYKYLSHLPLHSEFKIVELDLVDSMHPYLGEKTLALFRVEFEERQRLRQRKLAREKRECDRLAAAAAEKEAITPHYYIKSAMNEESTSLPKEIATSATIVNYLNEFPEASSSPPFSSGASLISDNSGSLSITTASSSSANAASTNGDSVVPAQVSFAQMLKHDPTTEPILVSSRQSTSTTTVNVWPALDQLTQTTTNMTAALTLGGWVNMAKQQQQQMNMSGRAKRCQNAPVSNEIDDMGVSDENEQERESMPAPSFKQSFFSAIDESLRNIESKKDVINDGQNGPITTKKKKKTKQLLFSTSLNRGF